jgi:hypothetical protein
MLPQEYEEVFSSIKSLFISVFRDLSGSVGDSIRVPNQSSPNSRYKISLQATEVDKHKESVHRSGSYLSPGFDSFHH